MNRIKEPDDYGPIYIDVTAARQGCREAVYLAGKSGGAGHYMNPGDARRLADDLTTAAGIVDQLAPPLQLKETSHV